MVIEPSSLIIRSSKNSLVVTEEDTDAVVKLSVVSCGAKMVTCSRIAGFGSSVGGITTSEGMNTRKRAGGGTKSGVPPAMVMLPAPRSGET